MNFDMAFILSILAILGSLLNFWKFGTAVKERALAEGKHLETIDQLRRDLDRAYEKIRTLECDTGKVEGDIIEIKNDIKHMLKAVERMEVKLDGHIDAHVEGSR